MTSWGFVIIVRNNSFIDSKKAFFRAYLVTILKPLDIIIYCIYFLENIDQDLTDGILRKADMPIVDTILCQEFLDVNARSDEMHSGFICAGGKGDEESCYVSQWNNLGNNLGILWDSPYLPIKIQNVFTKNRRDICLRYQAL